MPEMFGAMGGFIQGQEAADKHTMAMASVQDTASIIAARRLGMQEEQVKIDTAKMALANQQNFQRLMQQRAEQKGGGGGGTLGGGSGDASTQVNALADNFYGASELAMASGMPEQAKDYATAGSSMLRTQSQIEKTHLDKQKNNLKLLDRLLPGITDQRSWEQANMIFQMESGVPSPFAGHPYDPAMIKRLQDAVVTAKEKVEMGYKAARAREADAHTKESDFRTKVLLPSQAKLNDDRDAKLRKAGAGDQIPKAAEIKAITDLIQKDYNVTSDDQSIMAGARVQARPIAERMKELMQEHPEMPQSEAAKKAYQEARKRGDFAGLDKNPKLPGGSPKSALPLPSDKGKLKDGNWYTVKGKPMLLEGKQFYAEDEVKANAEDAKDEDDSGDSDDEDEE